MITQYTDSYSNPSIDIQNLIANKVSLLDEYILMQTGQYEYTALVCNTSTGKCTQYIISRSSSSGYSNYYKVNTVVDAAFEYTVTNEYYVYSNVGYGKSLELPAAEGVQSHSLAIICLVLLFAIFFKGVLFKCLDSKRRR